MKFEQHEHTLVKYIKYGIFIRWSSLERTDHIYAAYGTSKPM